MPLRTKPTWWGVARDAPDPRALVEFSSRLPGWTLYPDGPGAGVAPSEAAGFHLGTRSGSTPDSIDVSDAEFPPGPSHIRRLRSVYQV